MPWVKLQSDKRKPGATRAAQEFSALPCKKISVWILENCRHTAEGEK